MVWLIIYHKHREILVGYLQGIKGYTMAENSTPSNSASNSDQQNPLQEQVKSQIKALTESINNILALRKMTSTPQPK